MVAWTSSVATGTRTTWSPAPTTCHVKWGPGPFQEYVGDGLSVTPTGPPVSVGALGTVGSIVTVRRAESFVNPFTPTALTHHASGTLRGENGGPRSGELTAVSQNGPAPVPGAMSSTSGALAFLTYSS